jgi:peptidoglycan/LPS O-acetylase OafA/YrhL
MTTTDRPDTRLEHGAGGKFTIRNTAGVALFLFGTTYLWLTREFASPGLDTSGLWWGVTEVLSLVTLAGFTVATWALFKRRAWWAAAALASTVLGMLVLIPYWIGADSSGETAPWFTVLVHVLGCAGVFLLLLVPSLRAWVDRHVASGR